ncbi:MAG: hypothetical protein RIS35_62 [Pseudomonadota bacterium]|jgi:prevent-host-death family protein
MMNAKSEPPVYWSVAEAKQRLSEVLRLAAREPQPIYNRGRLVAALVDAEAFAAFERWRRETGAVTVGAHFEALRAALDAEGKLGRIAPGTDAEDPVSATPRADRPNAFATMLEEEFPAPAPAHPAAAAGAGPKLGGAGMAAQSRRPAGRGKR